jgi:hypothetical protein
MKHTKGKLLSGDFLDSTMTFEIQGEFKLVSGDYFIVPEDHYYKIEKKHKEMYEALKRSQELLENLNSPHAEMVKSVNESLLKEIES